MSVRLSVSRTAVGVCSHKCASKAGFERVFIVAAAGGGGTLE